MPVAFSKPQNVFFSSAGSASETRDREAFPNPDANFLAHDAHNWLTVLRVYCDLLRTTGVVAQSGERWIDELSKAVERGHGLVESLLESAMEAGEIGADEGAESGRETNRSLSPGVAALERRRDSRDRKTSDRRWVATRGEAKPGIAAEVEPLDIAAALLRRRTLLERLAGGRIHVEIDAAANAGNVALTEGEFARILQNLVGNAIEAMPRGGRLRITLRRGSRGRGKPGQSGTGAGAGPGGKRTTPRAMRPDSTKKGDRRSMTVSPQRKPTQYSAATLLLRIHDSGCGIAPEFLAGIFEAGVSGKAPGKEGHAPRGFGLAIVRELTQRAGGVVRVRSRPGKGTCFEIELPRV